MQSIAESERLSEDGAAPPAPRETAEQLFVEHLTSIQRLTTKVARQHRLSPDDAEEFAGVVSLRLIADDYAVLRKFRRQCSLHAYLTVVIQRMCLDFRNAEWGKWRASAAGRRNGRAGILLERLTMRDGLTFEEASGVLETNHGLTVERGALASIYADLRVRGRPRRVGEEELASLPAVDTAPDRVVLEAESAALLSRTVSTLVGAMQMLTQRDRLLLRLRFVDGLTVASVARLLSLDQKSLYRRYACVLRRLRTWLQADGVAAGQIAPLLGEVSTLMSDVFAPVERRSARSGKSSVRHPATL